MAPLTHLIFDFGVQSMAQTYNALTNRFNKNTPKNVFNNSGFVMKIVENDLVLELG